MHGRSAGWPAFFVAPPAPEVSFGPLGTPAGELQTQALDALPLPIFVINSDLHVEYANPAAASVLQRTPVKGAPSRSRCYESIYKRDTPCPQCPFETQSLEEQKLTTPGSNERSFRIFFGRLPGGQLVEMTEDITGRQREADRRIRTERLAAMGTMVSGVAHELNNPLTGMELNLQTLLANLETMEEAEVGRRLTMIRRDLNRASRIVMDVLGFARTGPLRLQKADMRQIADRARSNVVRLYGSLAREISWDIQSEGDTTFLFNPEKMERLFINLFRNSLQAFDYRSGAIRVHIAQSDAGCKITVEDDAGGIPPKVLERIFEPFSPGSGQVRGSGLGLAICHNIVSEHRGRIQAHSSGGKARFLIQLPAVLSKDG